MKTRILKVLVGIFILPIFALSVITSLAQAQHVSSEVSISSLDDVTTYQIGVGDVYFSVHPIGRIKLTPDENLYSANRNDLRFYNERRMAKYIGNNGIKIPDALSVGFYQAFHLDDILFVEMSDATGKNTKHTLLPYR